VTQDRRSQRKTARYMRLLFTVLLPVGLLLFTIKAQALVLTSYFETILVRNVSTSWTTVTLDNNYANAIPVCTYVLGTFAGSAGNYTNPPAVPRIRNIGSSSFELRIQGWEDSAASPADVHCIVMDEGAHTLPDGRLVEAHSVLSDSTSGQFATDGLWSLALVEDVSSSIVHPYSSPVVLGQVMSYNDSRASVVYVNDCDSRVNSPFQSGLADGICVGKHIGQIIGSRNPETIGYIVAEAGSGKINNVFYELALGADSVGGNNASNSGFSYSLSAHHTMAVLTQGAQDGGNGSWAVLYGNTPLTNGSMALAVDEQTFEGDTTRNHTTEEIYYWAFSGAEITLVKNLINDEDGTATVADFELTATGPNTISGTTGQASVTKKIVEPGTYLVSETTLPGYSAGDWVCTGATTASGSKIALVGGDSATCTITNDDIKGASQIASLTLIKELTNDAGGDAVSEDFILAFSGDAANGSGVTGDVAITSASVPPGLYSLSESALDGYTLDGVKCDGKDSDGSDGVEIFAGENVTCVFINNDQGVDLAIKKSVSDTTPNVGDTVKFELLVKNSGPNAATDFHVVDQIPAGFTYVASSITGGDVRNDSSPMSTGLDWTINTLPSGSTATLTFQATVLAP